MHQVHVGWITCQRRSTDWSVNVDVNLMWAWEPVFNWANVVSANIISVIQRIWHVAHPIPCLLRNRRMGFWLWPWPHFRFHPKDNLTNRATGDNIIMGGTIYRAPYHFGIKGKLHMPRTGIFWNLHLIAVALLRHVIDCSSDAFLLCIILGSQSWSS